MPLCMKIKDIIKQFLTQPETTRGQGTLVPRTRVLIGGDGHELKHPLSSSPVDAFRPQVHQNQVVVGPTWNTHLYHLISDEPRLHFNGHITFCILFPFFTANE